MGRPGTKPGERRGDYKENRKELFIKAFKIAGTKQHAAEAAGVDRKTVANWMKKDKAFARAFDDADTSVTELLERAAVQRAAYGILKPIFQNGMKVGEVREYSDSLAIFLLKARNPKKYRDNVKVLMGGEKGDAPIQVNSQSDFAKLTMKQLRALAAMVTK